MGITVHHEFVDNGEDEVIGGTVPIVCIDSSTTTNTGLLTSNPAACDVVPVPADAAGGGCRNLVTSVKYTVVLDPPGTIDQVFVAFEVGDAPAGLADRAWTQAHEVVFTEPGRMEQLEIDDIDMYPRSGNPGYLRGKPVLAGNYRRNTELNIIALNSNPHQWLVLPRAGPDGGCPADLADHEHTT